MRRRCHGVFRRWVIALRVQRRSCFYLLTCLMAMSPWILVAFLSFGKGPALQARSLLWRPHPPDLPTCRCRRGPWGDIEYTRIWLEIPQELLSAKLWEIQATRWLFPNYTPAMLDQLITTTVGSAELRRALMDRQKWQISTTGIRITPDAESILALSRSARVSLYQVLASAEENGGQARPFAWHRDQFSGWARNSGLSRRTMRFFRQLTWERGQVVLFSDTMALLSLVPPEDRAGVIRALGRSPVVMPRLRLQPDSDIDALVRYWSAHGSGRGLGPLLRSVVRQPGGAPIDLAHLLSPFARMRLHSHPPPRIETEFQQDCFWTAANYFNDTVDNTITNADTFAEHMMTHYVRVKEPAYGDVVLFVDSGGGLLHAANYVADDILFTKNGKSYRNGWTLCTMQDIAVGYGGTNAPDTVFFRKKDATSQSVTPARHVAVQSTPRPMPAEFEPHSALLLGCASLLQRHPGVFVNIVRAAQKRTPIVGLVADAGEAELGRSLLRSAGIPGDPVDFLAPPVRTMWVRDYGPIFLQSPDGTPFIADPELPIKSEAWQRYKVDDEVPARLAKALGLERVPVRMYLVGGNLLTNGDGLGLFTARLARYNQTRGLGIAQIDRMMREQLGLTSPVMVPELVGEPTGDVDMFVAVLARDMAVVGEISPDVDAENSSILDEVAAVLSRQQTSSGPMRVHRVPMPPRLDGRWRTYTNVVFVEGALLVPSFSDVSPAVEERVRGLYAELLPGRTVVPICCDDLLDRRGLLHCITRGVPAFVPVQRLKGLSL